MKLPVKLIKKAQRELAEVPNEHHATKGVDRWSKAVHTWVSEFQQKDRRADSLPAFDSLFKTSLRQGR